MQEREAAKPSDPNFREDLVQTELMENQGKAFRLHELVAVVRDDGTVVKMRVYDVRGTNKILLKRVPGELPTQLGVPG